MCVYIYIFIYQRMIWGFPNHLNSQWDSYIKGETPNGWFIGEKLGKWTMMWGYPHFWNLPQSLKVGSFFP